MDGRIGGRAAHSRVERARSLSAKISVCAYARGWSLGLELDGAWGVRECANVSPGRRESLQLRETLEYDCPQSSRECLRARWDLAEF